MTRGNYKKKEIVKIIDYANIRKDATLNLHFKFNKEQFLSWDECLNKIKRYIKFQKYV